MKGILDGFKLLLGGVRGGGLGWDGMGWNGL